MNDNWMDDISEENLEEFENWLADHEAKVRAGERTRIAEAIRECIDWSSGRTNYGDNDGHEEAARIAEET